MQFHLSFIHLIACSLFALLAEGQSGLSRQATRFLFWDQGHSGIDSMSSLTVPSWFPVQRESNDIYAGAVSRYALPGLTECMAGGTFPYGNHSFRWDLSTRGDVNFRRSAVQAGVVKMLSPRLFLGSGLGLSFTRVKGYGTSALPYGSLSLSGLMSSSVCWGLSWENPQSVLSGKNSLRGDPMRVRAGMTYSISERLSMYGGMEWESPVAAGVHLRMQYHISKEWRVDAGWAWSPDQWILGIRRVRRRGSVALGFSQDPVLGSSFSLLSSWVGSFKK